MAKKIGLTRRHFLRGAAGLGGAVALSPLLPLLPSRADDGYPLRLIVNFTRPGMPGRDYRNGMWGPQGTETSFSLRPGSILEPLATAGIEQDCVFLQGVDNPAHREGPQVGGHPNGNGTQLTGTPLQEGTLFSGGGPDTGGWPSGPSIDQYIASRLSGETTFDSLELGVQITTGSNLQGRVAYRGADMPVAPDDNPFSVFGRLFGSMAGSEEELLRLYAERRSILDVVYGDLDRLKGRVGTEDRIKIEQHESALRSVEMRLAPEDPPGGVMCEGPTMPGALDHRANDNYPLVGDLQQDLMVQAMACDLTRVGLMQWSRGPGPVRYTWLGYGDDVHNMSHAPDSDTVTQNALTQIARFQAEKFARLVNALKAVPEGDGTLFDHTIVVWCTELAEANNHQSLNMPYVIAAGSGTSITTNRFKTYSGATNNQLWVSMCHAMGLTDVTEFGDPRFAQGPLAGLVG